MARRKKHINKQGISPLIATVLIIGFTVALAVIIINWGNTFTRGIQDQTESSTDVQITCAQDVVYTITNGCVDVVPGAGTLSITVSNDGTLDIDEFIIRVSNQTGGVVEQTTNNNGGAGFTSFGIETISIAPPGEADTPSNVELIPRVTVGGSPETCASNRIDFGGDDSVALPVC